MDTNVNIKKLREELGFSQQELADKTGIPKGRINAWEQRGTKPKLDDFNKLQEFINENKGIQNGIINAPNGRFGKKVGVGLVKFYDVDFAAGDIEFYDDTNSITPAYEMDIPEFAGCTAFRTYGDSMEPAIKSGSILFGTRVEDWQSHLEYGQIYGIVCTDKRKYLKYIRKDKENPKANFLLRSENQEYDDFELPKTKIKSIWLIHGWINKRN
jgi:transcriptional regulator with XRE-family HTH domain